MSKIKKRLLTYFIPITGMASLGFLVPLADAQAKETPHSQQELYQAQKSIDSSQTNFTFYLGKSSGIPFGGKQVIQWEITDDNGKSYGYIDDVADGYQDGKYSMSLPHGNYHAKLVNGLSNDKHYQLPPTTVDFNSDNPLVDLTYRPQMYDQGAAPTTPYVVNDVLYNYKFNDVFDRGYSLYRNQKTNKMTIMFFFKTRCPHSIKSIDNLQTLLNKNHWNDKVNVLCLSSEDSLADLRNFSRKYNQDNFYFIQIPNNNLKDQIVRYAGYPSIAFVDYQGTLVDTKSGDTFEQGWQARIKQFSKPGLLTKPSDQMVPNDKSHIDVNQPEVNLVPYQATANDVEPYLNLVNGQLPKTLDQLRKTKPEEIAKVSRYDSRDYHIVSPVKDQGREGLCWSFATASAIETALFREGITPNTSFRASTHNIDQVSNRRNIDYDPLGLNNQDKWKGQSGAGWLPEYAMNALSMWTAPVDETKYGNIRQYLPPEYYLENSEVLITRNMPVDQKVPLIKQMIAKYGAISVSYSCRGTDTYTNTNDVTNHDAGHAVTIVGWDDSIPASKYRPTAARNGGWICKNSWGPSWGPKGGYFYMSYDSPFAGLIGYDFDIAHNKYDNNYYYDAKATDAGRPEAADGKDAAVIFPVKKANFDTQEFLTAINVGVESENTTIHAKIYKNPKDVDFSNPTWNHTNPESGQLVATVSKHLDHPGYSTIRLDTPVELFKDETFSIVVQTDNPSHDSKLYYSADKSTNNMTFYKNGNQWVNPMTQLTGSAARIKAFTKEVKIANANSNNINDATVTLSSVNYRFGDLLKPQVQSIQIGKKNLTWDDYDLYYEKPTYTKEAKDTGSSEDVIGHGAVTIIGKNGYVGSKTIPYDILVGIAPDTQGKAWYTDDGYNTLRVINFNVKQSAQTYQDIDLPEGFSWQGDPSQVIDDQKLLSLDYHGVNQDKYRHTYFNGSYYVRLHRVPDDNQQALPPTLIPQEQNDDLPPPDIPTDEYNLAYADIQLDGTEFDYTGHPIKPTLKSIRMSDGATPTLVPRNFIIKYEDNILPGTGKVIVIGNTKDGFYFGRREIPFTITNKSHKPVVSVDPNQNQYLGSLNLVLNKSIYNRDDTIVARANVIPIARADINPADIKYKWEVVDSGSYIPSHEGLIALDTNHDFANKELKVTATYKDESVSASSLIQISPVELPDERPTIIPPGTQPPTPNNPVGPNNPPVEIKPVEPDDEDDQEVIVPPVQEQPHAPSLPDEPELVPPIQEQPHQPSTPVDPTPVPQPEPEVEVPPVVTPTPKPEVDVKPVEPVPEPEVEVPPTIVPTPKPEVDVKPVEPQIPDANDQVTETPTAPEVDVPPVITPTPKPDVDVKPVEPQPEVPQIPDTDNQEVETPTIPEVDNNVPDIEVPQPEVDIQPQPEPEVPNVDNQETEVPTIPDVDVPHPEPQVPNTNDQVVETPTIPEVDNNVPDVEVPENNIPPAPQPEVDVQPQQPSTPVVPDTPSEDQGLDNPSISDGDSGVDNNDGLDNQHEDVPPVDNGGEHQDSVVPDLPNDHVEPEVDVIEPQGDSHSQVPTTPSQPDQSQPPVAPSQPSKPSQQSKPQPSKPSQPSKPTKPATKPSQPSKPTKPSSKPVKPSQPAELEIQGQKPTIHQDAPTSSNSSVNKEAIIVATSLAVSLTALAGSAVGIALHKKPRARKKTTTKK